jgi:glycine/D-amino acid oxidase-like deaminating enzyme/nitrite reductase/ring-hydroxylating ferredoxin subunit
MGSLHETNRSLWVATTPETNHLPMGGNAKVEVAVVGAGIAGLTTAYLLHRAGVSVAVVEAGRIASGATGYTTAKLSSLQGLTYAGLLQRHGEEKARLYAQASQAAVDKVGAIAEQEGIACDYRRLPAFTYTENGEGIADIEKEVEAAQGLGLPATFTTDTDLPYAVKGAVRFENQAMFHPRKYCIGLAALIDGDGSRVFERTRALGVEEGDNPVVLTDQGKLHAGHVVIATHLPFIDKGAFFARTSPSRSYALAARMASPPQGLYLSTESPTRSIRPYEEEAESYVLLGGEGHKVGQDPDTSQRYAALEAFARRFNVESIEFRWSAEDYTPADGLPYVGAMTSDSDRLLVATGFNKWGMTSGTAAGMILADLILGRPNPWVPAFDATRLAPGASAKKVVTENLDAAKHLVGDRLHDLAADDVEALDPGQGSVARWHGRKVAAYRDEAGQLHAVSPSCTHMGCTVAFNTAEKTWDCPCHGSRFDLGGRVIQGPAVKDLETVSVESPAHP